MLLLLRSLLLEDTKLSYGITRVEMQLARQ